LRDVDGSLNKYRNRGQCKAHNASLKELLLLKNDASTVAFGDSLNSCGYHALSAGLLSTVPSALNRTGL
jgi:hypothetical protein